MNTQSPSPSQESTFESSQAPESPLAAAIETPLAINNEQPLANEQVSSQVRQPALVIASVLVALAIAAAGVGAALTIRGESHESASPSLTEVVETTTSSVETTTSSTTTAEPLPTAEAQSPAPQLQPSQAPNGGLGGGSGYCSANWRTTVHDYIGSLAGVGIGLTGYSMRPDNEQRPSQVSIRAQSAPEWPSDPYAQFDVVCVGGNWEIQKYAYVDQPISNSTMFKAIVPNLVGGTGASAINWVNSIGGRQIIVGQVSSSCLLTGAGFVGDPAKVVTTQNPAAGTVVRSGSNFSIMC